MIKFTTKKFNRQIRTFAKKTGLKIDLVAKKLAFEAFRSVVQKTPVDTGRARASWNIERGTIDPSVPSKELFEGGNRSAAAARNSRQLGKASVTVISKIPIYFITSNLKYIIYLEKGHSKQADSGFMVRRTLIELRVSLDNLVRAL